MQYKIIGKEIYLENEVIVNGSILIEDDLIRDINSSNESIELIDLSHLRIFPGLVDMHVHGGNGSDVMDGDYDAINQISKYKLLEGVTSFCPTTVTAPLNKIYDAIKNVKEAMKKGVDGAKIVGTYIEGPYISPIYKGAHPEEFIRDIHIPELEALITHGEGSIKVIALAPEKENAIEAIQFLKEQGICTAIGHTNATYEEATRAILAGATIGIHTYNAMRGLHQTEPGTLGAIMNNKAITGELIADTVHVKPASMEILIKVKGADKIALITDCMRAGGLPDGEYYLGELPVTVTNSIARIASGSLAGSTLKLIQGAKNIVENTTVSLQEAVNMASIVPAKALGIDQEVGSIREGKKADLIGVDDEFNIRFVMIDGRILYTV